MGKRGGGGCTVAQVTSRTTRFRFGSPFSSKRLWFVDTVQSSDFVPRSYRHIELAVIAAHLNAEIILVVKV